jgi:type IV pilus assembly protein PilY1
MKHSSLATGVRTASLAVALLAALVTTAQATTPLADQPVFSAVSVPGNLALALSVEWPTVSRAAHPSSSYSSSNTYRGYFDHDKCYRYVRVTTETATDVSRFDPVGLATDRQCPATGESGDWSGNFLNWATMIAIDPFRWALTGGLRKVDAVGTTVLERARHSGQGSLFPNRTLNNATTISNATPFTWGSLTVRTQGAGTRLIFSSTGNVNSGTPTHYAQGTAVDSTTVYEVQARVKVCDPAFPESNCRQYSATNLKPEGLIQEYSDRMRYSAFGYLNDPSMLRDGGVLRAAQKFVGPKKPVPGSADVSNPAFEWSATTGIFETNPDAADATATTTEFGIAVGNSGVINYLNKFGQLTTNNHKDHDPVSELFYAVTRYFRNLGNVPAWTAMGSATTAEKTRYIDGFPVITDWKDPIEYSCQRNFVLGIGDIYTHRDKNLPGSGTGTTDEPTKPSQVNSDTVDSVSYTTKAFSMQGLGTPNANSYSGRNNSAGMVGLAYHANTQDLRTDVSGMQTLSTYWVDVLEAPFVANNQFYLAAKYGGFTVPSPFDPLATTTTSLDEAWWYTAGRTEGSTKLPDNYFTAGKPEDMINGLRSAFASIASKIKAYTTSFSTSLPQISTIGVASYATQFDAKSWTGELVASSSTLSESTGAPTLVESWRFSARLGTQAAGTGWDTDRLIATYNTETGAGVPFRSGTGGISASQLLALDTSYRSGDDSVDYLNYLRGERRHERSSTATGSAKAYRDRISLVGDIVGSKSRPIGRPDAPYSSAANPGYADFKNTYKDRKTMVYVGTNQGMLHAVDGSLTGSTAGREVFAYVPGALYAGANGLKVLGNPDFVHYNFVDATPLVADVDFGKTGGVTAAADWRTILVGGLGKGGKSLYAIDVTNPAAMTTEGAVASKVLWEFSHPKLGYTYGEPALVKTKKHGWVLIFGSGYNNSDGQGYFFIVNPKTGALIGANPIGTGEGSTGDDAGLAHVQAFMLDRTDGTADSVYAGDLHGNLWRLDLTDAAGNYPAPTKIAALTDASNVRLPVTSRPLVVVQPKTNRRFVTVGTGRLLHPNDLTSSQAQRYFAIIDGSGVRFNKSADLPTGITFPITRSKLKELTDLTQEVKLDFANEIGWYVDLGRVAGGPGWRVISDSTSFLGVVAFSAMVPAAEAACESSGRSRVYAIDLGTGASKLKSGDVVAPYLSPQEGVVTDLRFYSVAGKPRLLAGYDTGKNEPLPGEWTPAIGLRRLNWREIPLAD